MSNDGRVLEVLHRTARHLAAIRTPGNGEDVDAHRAAHESFAELFALGMTDSWLESEGEDQPSPESWGWNCEPLEPNSDWAPETRARFHHVCGDLNLLHSNDAGLNAAKSNYENAVGVLREIDPESAVLCYARLLRAAAYASYSARVIFENLDGLVWATDVARSAPSVVRDELELSVVEMSSRMFADAFSALAEPEPEQVETSRQLLQRLLHELCARADTLPFRRSLPHLIAGKLAGTELLDGDALVPFFRLSGTEDLPAWQLHAAERAEALEDGTFYPHGGCLSPDEYVKATRERAARLRIGALVALGRREAVDIVDALIAEHQAEYQESQRAQLEVLKLRAAAAAGDTELWRESAAEFLEWLEPRAREYWWRQARLSEWMDAIESLAVEHGFDELVDRVHRVRVARDGA